MGEADEAEEQTYVDVDMAALLPEQRPLWLISLSLYVQLYQLHD